MRYLIVKTDVRPVPPEELASAWANGQRVRDERVAPEPRRQMMFAEDREVALHLARALASVGAVRSGRQRVKVVRLGEPPRRRPEPGTA